MVVGIAMPAAAQLSGIQGTVTDTSRAVLPGVAVRATHLDTGTSQEVVTNAEGRYFFQGVRLGSYELTAALSGFMTIQRRGVTVEVGRTVTLDMEMSLATLQETVLVTSDAPLIDVVDSQIGGNLNVRHLDSTPINGRQWTMMTNLAPGARGTGSNASWTVGNPPAFGSGTSITKMNVDGGQINSAKNGVGGTLDYSQYTIQEVEVLSSRFGAQHGHAGGGIINAVTRSGTNTLAGSAYGFFRDDAFFNAKDFFTDTVLPFNNSQFGALVGGPIRRDKTFFFASWESERAPQTVPIVKGVPALDVTYENDTIRDLGFVKVDYQFKSNQRLTSSLNLTKVVRLVSTEAPAHISTANATPNYAQAVTVKHVSTLTNSMLNEITAMYTNFHRPITSHLYFRNGGRISSDPTNRASMDKWGSSNFPGLIFPQGRIGAIITAFGPGDEKFVQLKDDFSLIKSGRFGEHSLHAGGEYLYQWVWGQYEADGFGVYRFTQNPRDWAAVVAVLEANDYAGLQRLVDTGIVPQPVNFIQSVGDAEHLVVIPTWSAYVQDDWRVNSRLTANLGLRYDIEAGGLRGSYNKTRFLQRPDMLGRPNSDTDNWQPRFGFNWVLDDRSSTVVRGGAGRYYDQSYSNEMSQVIQQNDGDHLFAANVLNDRSSTFMSNPLGKYSPSCNAQTLLNIPDPPDCANALIAAGLSTNLAGVVPWYEMNYTDQYSLGVHHQLTDSLAVGADVVRVDGKDESYNRDANLWVDCGDGRKGTYPGTWPGPACNGPTLPVATYGRPDPRFANTAVRYSDGYSRYDALQVNLTKRFSQRHQYQLSYILSKTESTGGGAIENGLPISEQYGTSGADERNRLTAIASVALPWDTQLSGVFFYSGGSAYNVFQNLDLDGDLSFNDRTVLADGSKKPVNSGWSDPVYRVDMRLAKQVRIRGNLKAEGMIELFNALNHQNYNSFTGNLRSTRFGLPNPTTNLLYQPRMGQLAFRILW